VRETAALTDKSFGNFVREHKFVLVHFWAEWNLIDRKMSERLALEIPIGVAGSVALASFDIDPEEHHAICRVHGLRNVPFLAFYRDGVVITTLTGFHPIEVITEALSELVAPSGG
jgi:thioredoxin-like negative regulator of GroEL